MPHPSYTPITELDPAVCNLADIVPDYAKPEQIGLNLAHLGRVAAWGGFYRDNVAIRGVTGETSTYNPSIVGHDGFGTAFMGAGAVKTATLSEGLPGESRDNRWRHRTNLRIQVNTSELLQRVQDSGSSREPANWAKHINQAVAMGVRGGAWRNLAGRPLPDIEAILAGSSLVGSTVANASFSLLSGSPAAETLGADLMVMRLAVVMGTVNLARAMGLLIEQRSWRDCCFSLIPVWHLDRVAVVSGLSRMRPFVRVIQEPDAAGGNTQPDPPAINR